MAKQVSKNHHILPQCYLKGFTHDGKQLFLYDKLKDEIRPGNIKKSFTSYKRNTVTWPGGETSDWLEDMYGGVESQSAYLFPKIINSTSDKEAYTYMDKLMLGMFISTLLWRVPSVDHKVQQLIATEGFKNRKFHIEYPEGWSMADRQKLESLILAEPAFQKTLPFMLALEPFLHEQQADFLKGWKFYYHDPGRFFVGDNPVIARVAKAAPKDSLAEFILPLAPNRILVASNGRPPQLDRDWAINMNLQQINQAERYVCSNDRPFLTAIVSLYKSENHTVESDYLKNKLFQEII